MTDRDRIVLLVATCVLIAGSVAFYATFVHNWGDVAQVWAAVGLGNLAAATVRVAGEGL